MKAALVLIAALLAAGAAAAQSAPGSRTGKSLFDEHCALCHNARGHASTLMGKRLGPEQALLETRINPSEDLIVTVVREGINSMPPLRRAELSDADLKTMTDYLTSPPEQRQGGAR